MIVVLIYTRIPPWALVDVTFFEFKFSQLYSIRMFFFAIILNILKITSKCCMLQCCIWIVCLKVGSNFHISNWTPVFSCEKKWYLVFILTFDSIEFSCISHFFALLFHLTTPLFYNLLIRSQLSKRSSMKRKVPDKKPNLLVKRKNVKCLCSPSIIVRS